MKNMDIKEFKKGHNSRTPVPDLTHNMPCTSSQVNCVAISF